MYESKLLTDIAVDRRPVNRVVPPHHLVDELDQVLGAHPENVEDTADVPCCAHEKGSITGECLRRQLLRTFQVPVERDRYQDKGKQRERCFDVDLSLPRDCHLGISVGFAGYGVYRCTEAEESGG